jgi:molecular chaperone GrpE (heat shock protein)
VEVPVEQSVTRAEVEKLIATAIEKRLQQAIEELSVQSKEIMLKELNLIERVVQVERELEVLRKRSEVKAEESKKRFDA